MTRTTEGAAGGALTVLVSRTGSIQELASFDDGERLAVATLQGALHAPEGFAVQLRRIGELEYRGRQLWRVCSVLWKQPRARRRRAGLTAGELYRDLDYLYEVACRFRANVYSRDYSSWHAEFYDTSPSDRRSMLRRSHAWQHKPMFRILILTDAEATADQEALVQLTQDSLLAQVYDRYTCVVLPMHEGLQLLLRVDEHIRAEATAAKDPRWTILLRPGTLLAESALYWLAHAGLQSGDAGVIYTDHDRISCEGGYADPVFKPDWSAESLRSSNYIGPSFALRDDVLGGIHSSLALSRYPFDAMVYALLLDCANRTKVEHVPAPLWHLSADTVDAGALTAEITAQVVDEHLRAQGVAARVDEDIPGRCRIRYPIPEWRPLVTLVVPTRDGLSYLRTCIDSVQKTTAYRRFEIIVVDNQSERTETLDYLNEISRMDNVRVLPFYEPFNYSKINNFAVRYAAGDLICLLNNDTEVISPDWLGEMVSLLLSQPDIGVVGAKLLYGDGTVQHAGDTVGPGGCANHLHVGIQRDDGGYAGRALVAQELSAVTAACLLTRKALYTELDGLNERDLPVAFNDVDFCLRARAAGYRVLWTPHALLHHHESVSRGKDRSRAQIKRAKGELKYMRKRWGHLMGHDPFYNPNLNYLQPDFTLSATPHGLKPW